MQDDARAGGTKEPGPRRSPGPASCLPDPSACGAPIPAPDQTAERLLRAEQELVALRAALGMLSCRGPAAEAAPAPGAQAASVLQAAGLTPAQWGVPRAPAMPEAAGDSTAFDASAPTVLQPSGSAAAPPHAHLAWAWPGGGEGQQAAGGSAHDAAWAGGGGASPTRTTPGAALPPGMRQQLAAVLQRAAVTGSHVDACQAAQRTLAAHVRVLEQHLAAGHRAMAALQHELGAALAANAALTREASELRRRLAERCDEAGEAAAPALVAE